MTALLVSVRSAAEARAALNGGADILDVKEPDNGPLGAAAPEIVRAVAEVARKKVPVSVACGDMEEGYRPLPEVNVRFVKWGLAEWESQDWQSELGQLLVTYPHYRAGCSPVPVAYADHLAANAPSPADIAAFACETKAAAFLIDTFEKDGRTLLDHIDLPILSGIVADCRAAGVRVALAGSLGMADIAALWPLRPDWFAVRGLVCDGGRRGTVSRERVAAVKDWLRRRRDGP